MIPHKAMAPSIIQSVRNVALPKSPKLQMTAADSPTSVAVYWRIVVADVQIAPIPIPAKIIVEGLKLAILESPKTRKTDIRAKRKAKAEVEKGLALAM